MQSVIAPESSAARGRCGTEGIFCRKAPCDQRAAMCQMAGSSTSLYHRQPHLEHHFVLLDGKDSVSATLGKKVKPDENIKPKPLYRSNLIKATESRFAVVRHDDKHLLPLLERLLFGVSEDAARSIRLKPPPACSLPKCPRSGDRRKACGPRTQANLGRSSYRARRGSEWAAHE